MISKTMLRKRLSVAIDKQLTPSEFTFFFACFCEHDNRHDLRTAKELSHEDAAAFSRYAGYDLLFPIPLPLIGQISKTHRANMNIR